MVPPVVNQLSYPVTGAHLICMEAPGDGLLPVIIAPCKGLRIPESGTFLFTVTNLRNRVNPEHGIRIP